MIIIQHMLNPLGTDKLLPQEYGGNAGETPTSAATAKCMFENCTRIL
jgi:hypothetical protein